MLKQVLKYWREITIAILIIIVAISVKSCRQHIDNEQVAIHAHDSVFTVVQHHKLMNGQLANQVQVHEVTIGQLKNDLGISRDSLKHLKAQVGSLSNLVGYWKGKALVKDTFKVALHDTIYKSGEIALTGKDFEWSGKYLSLKGFIPSDEASISISYKYNLTWTLVSYRKPRPFISYLKFNFKQMPLVADITFDDPNIEVQKFSGVVIKEGPKKWYQTTAAKVGLGLVIGKLLWK